MNIYEAIEKLSVDEYKKWWINEYSKLLKERYNDLEFVLTIKEKRK